MANTKIVRPPCFAKFELKETGTSCYAVTTHGREKEATAMMYPGVQEEIRQKLGGDYYVVPYTVHEIFAIPKTGTFPLEKLQKVLAEKNRIQSPEERLGSKIYEYNGREKKLLVCRADKVRNQER